MKSAKATRELYREQQRIQRELLSKTRRIWRGMGGDWDASFGRISPDLVGAVSESQVEMAKVTTDFMNNFLAEVSIRDTPVAEVQPASLAGYSSDGYPLDGLLYGSVSEARSAGLEGRNAPQALDQGRKWLDTVSTSQIADVTRAATMLGTSVRDNLSGYTRFLSPPSCQRCAVLAARVYRYSTGFKRHPRCDCIMVPVESEGWAKSEGFVLDPTEDLSVVKDLTRAQRAAIDAGADFNQVVNSQRGMLTVGEGARRRQITLAGTTSRGVYGRSEIARTGQIVRDTARRQGAVENYRLSRSATPRLTPQQIMRQARNRDELIEYLRKYKYIYR